MEEIKNVIAEQLEYYDNDVVNVILNYTNQMEMKEKMDKCINTIHKIKHVIVMGCGGLMHSYRWDIDANTNLPYSVAYVDMLFDDCRYYGFSSQRRDNKLVFNIFTNKVIGFDNILENYVIDEEYDTIDTLKYEELGDGLWIEKRQIYITYN